MVVKCKRYVHRLLQEESGQGMVEYGLIVALASVVLMAFVGLVAPPLKVPFERVAAELKAALARA